MKKIQKFLLMGIALFLAAGFVACTESAEYVPAEKESGAQVYFPSTFSTEQLVNDDATSLTIPVKRANAAEALTVTVASTCDNTLFSIPASVTFAEGQDTANLVISFLKALETDTNYEIALLLNDPDNTTIYGASQIEFTIAVWPWEYIGVGTYRDGYMCDIFGDPVLEYQVVMHEHKDKKGLYLVEDMFGWSFLTEYFGATQAQVSGQFAYTTRNIQIDATDAANVSIPEQWIGLNEFINGYQDFYILAVNGTLEEGIITFPAGGVGFAMTGYQNGAVMGANSMETFRLILPGYVAKDYTMGMTYAGSKVAANNTDAAAVVNLTYGADVEGIKYVIVEGEYQDDPSALYAAIVAGGENVFEVEDFEKGAGQVSLEFALPTQKFYTIAAMPVDGDKAVVEKEAAAIRFYFPGLQDPDIPACQVAVGLYKPSEILNEQAAAMYPDFSNLVYMIQGNDLVALKLYAGPAEVLDNPELYGETYASIIANYASDISGWALPDIAELGYTINLMDDLDPLTGYKVLLYAQNKWGSEALVLSNAGYTDQYPYEGELAWGDYLMSYTAKTSEGEEVKFESVFSLKLLYDSEAGAASETVYAVQSLGSNMLDDEFYAFYDAEKKTLTLDGQMIGGQQNTNYFGNLLYYMDSTQSSAVGYFTYDPANNESQGGDPLVFTVGGEAGNKMPVALQTDLLLTVYDLTTNPPTPLTYLGYYLADGTTIVPYVEEEDEATPAPAMMSVKPIDGKMRTFSMSNFAGTEKVDVEFNNAPRFVKAEVRKSEPAAREAFTVATLKVRN